jgi:mRNA-degrading endonuclease RelE of RelBE toxin-antitoxin system
MFSRVDVESILLRGMAMYALEYSNRAKKDIRRISHQDQDRIGDAVGSFAGNLPQRTGSWKPLVHGRAVNRYGGDSRLAVGKFRVLLEIDDKNKKLYVIRVFLRGDPDYALSESSFDLVIETLLS